MLNSFDLKSHLKYYLAFQSDNKSRYKFSFFWLSGAPSYAGAVESLTFYTSFDQSHKKADQSEIDAVMSLVKRLKFPLHRCKMVRRKAGRNLNGLSLIKKKTYRYTTASTSIGTSNNFWDIARWYFGYWLVHVMVWVYPLWTSLESYGTDGISKDVFNQIGTVPSF